MTTFSEAIADISYDLHRVGIFKDADELQHWANMASNQALSIDARKDALREITLRCHVKWLGDLYLPHLSQREWWDKLDKLHRLARKQMRFTG